jgi:hypothetical protein
MAGGGLRDGVIVLGRHGAADADRAHDAAAVHDRDAALAEDELVASLST